MQYQPKKRPQKDRNQTERSRLLRQPALYIGLISGIILAVLIGILATLVFSSHSVSYQPSPAASQAGNITITVDHNALNLGMQLAIQQVQPQLPFTITGVSTMLREGDEVDVSVTGQPILGIIPNVLITISPIVASDGTLDFQVQQVTFSGLNLSLGGAVNQAIEQAINQQFAGYGRGDLAQGLHYQLLDVRTTADALVLMARLTAS